MATQLIKWLDTEGREHDTEKQALAADARSEFLQRLEEAEIIFLRPSNDAKVAGEIYDWLMRSDLYDFGSKRTAPFFVVQAVELPPVRGLERHDRKQAFSGRGVGFPTEQHNLGTLPDGCTAFKEPGTGLWMLLYEYYVVTDDGHCYTSPQGQHYTFPGVPPVNIVASLRRDATFRVLHDGLEDEDIGYTDSIDEPCPLACNVVRGAQMLTFWQTTDPSQLEYR